MTPLGILILILLVGALIVLGMGAKNWAPPGWNMVALGLFLYVASILLSRFA
jgi:hypothetical protein